MASGVHVLIQEDLRLTTYRFEVARNMPEGPYRDILINAISARLDSLRRAAPDAGRRAEPHQ